MALLCSCDAHAVYVILFICYFYSKISNAVRSAITAATALLLTINLVVVLLSKIDVAYWNLDLVNNHSRLQRLYTQLLTIVYNTCGYFDANFVSLFEYCVLCRMSEKSEFRLCVPADLPRRFVGLSLDVGKHRTILMPTVRQHSIASGMQALYSLSSKCLSICQCHCWIVPGLTFLSDKIHTEIRQVNSS